MLKKEYVELHKGSKYEKHLRVPIEALESIQEMPKEDQEEKEARYAEHDRVSQLILKKATEVLSEEGWKAILFKFYIGMSNEQIGEQFKKSAAKVAVILNNSFNILRTKLRHEKELGEWAAPLLALAERTKRIRQKRSAKWKGKLPEGVRFYSAIRLNKPFVATIKVKEKLVQLGYYETPEKARRAILLAKRNGFTLNKKKAKKPTKEFLNRY